ncbi:MAG: STAS domain-containing protein [Rhodothermales bacterium]
MDFNIEHADEQTAIVHIGRTLDYRNASDFKSLSQATVALGMRQFVLNFSETGILDSTGLGAIFSLQRTVAGVGGNVVFAALSYPVRAIVQIVKIYNIFPAYKTVDNAIDALTVH